jgi:gamma-glutamyltranspeptidase/glutathione hydrolase
MKTRRTVVMLVAALALAAPTLQTSSQPYRVARELVVSESDIASRAGAGALAAGGNAIDAAVTTAFALAVTHPQAGNIGGGGFIVYRPAKGEPVAYDFREVAPEAARPEMFLVDGRYDADRHHQGGLSVGVPGTVAGLHLAWTEKGSLPWRRLVEPAIALARDGFPVSVRLARSLASESRFRSYPASLAQFTRAGAPYEPGDVLKQPDLARTLERIAAQGPAGFYEGETARLIAEEVRARGGLITTADLAAYRAKRRVPIRGTYRGHEVISMPPVSSGGVTLLMMLNQLEHDDLRAAGFGSATTLHLMAESMRRAFAARAQHLGDPDFNPDMPVARLVSKEHGAALRRTIDPARATPSSPASFEWPAESHETTHLSVMDAARNAVSLTYTLEYGYGSAIVVPGAGFILNNEMGDFNAGPGLTTAEGLVGTPANLARPGKRMLSSMTPTILAKDGAPLLVTGSPGGRTIINTVLQTILNVVDHGMNAQEAVDAARVHHQWLPDRLSYERNGFSPDTLALLARMGHTLTEVRSQGVAQVILVEAKTGVLEAGIDRRGADSGAAGR